MATMRMYCPSLKQNVEATITDGKRVASKGGSLRNIIYGKYEGRKCLPKTVKAEVFAQHGFAAEFHLKEDFTEGIDDDMIAIHNEKGKRVGMVSVENAGGDDDVNVAITYPVSPPFYTGALKEKTVLVGDEAYDIRSAESATYEPSQEPEGSTPATEPTNANFEAEGDWCPECNRDWKHIMKEGHGPDCSLEAETESFCSSCGSHKRAEGCGCMAAETFEASTSSYCKSSRRIGLKEVQGGKVPILENCRNKAIVTCDNFTQMPYGERTGCEMAYCSSCLEDAKKDHVWIEIKDDDGNIIFEGCDGCQRDKGFVWNREKGGYVKRDSKKAESSPSSFDISWEDAQGVSSPSLPPEGIHFAEQEGECEVCFAKNDGTGNLTQCNRCEKQICLGDMDACSSICGECGTYCCDACLMSNENCANCDASYRAEQGKNIKFCNGCNKRTNFEDGECNFCAFPEFGAEGEYSATMCDSCEAIYPEDDEGDVCECGGTIRNLYEYEDGSADFESEYHLNGETCEHCAEEVQLNAEGFCSECYEDLYLSETMAAEGISRNGKLVLGLTALGVGMAMALGSERVASLLDKLNRK